MGCWVVPVVAAEMWNVPVNQVLEGIRSGKIPTKTELGFTLVDVAPGSPATSIKRPPEQRPNTFTAVRRTAKSAPVPVPPPPAEVDEDDPNAALDWRQVRLEVQRLRKRPMACVPLAQAA
jgi:hypothetical protein